MSQELTPGGAGQDAASPIIKLVDVTKSYRHLNVLKPVNMDIRDGEFLTILGPSGSGKTTILRMIGGFTEPSSGTILLRGTDIAKVPIFRRPFNTVFQDYALFPHMSVAKNVGYGLRIRKTPRDDIKRRVAAVLETVNLSDKAQKYPSELSGGQRQRVALARAIVCEPEVILLDEPLAALDAELRRSMQSFLKDLQRRIQTTFVFITHDQQEAVSMSDRIAVMDHGNLVQVGTPKEIYYQPKNEFVARFFGENNLLPVTRRAQGSETVFESALGTHVAPGAIDGGLVAVRPESFRLHDGSQLRADERLFSSRLDRVNFMGATTELVLAPRADTVVNVRIPTAGLPSGLEPGSDVTVRWSETDAKILPRNA